MKKPIVALALLLVGSVSSSQAGSVNLYQNGAGSQNQQVVVPSAGTCSQSVNAYTTGTFAMSNGPLGQIWVYGPGSNSANGAVAAGSYYVYVEVTGHFPYVVSGNSSLSISW